MYGKWSRGHLPGRHLASRSDGGAQYHGDVGESGGTATLSVSVVSDPPDSVTADSTTTVAVGIFADSVDVPVLPQWGVGLMAILLMSLILWSRRQQL